MEQWNNGDRKKIDIGLIYIYSVRTEYTDRYEWQRRRPRLLAEPRA